MSDFAERMAEERIREAMNAGKFDNLVGAGKPLSNLGPRDQESWLAQFIEREELEPLATAPTVLGLRKEAQSYPESLAGCVDEAEVRARLADYNRRVKRDRLHPALDLPIPIVAPIIDIETMVEQWRTPLQGRREERASD